jgi:HSF-type DNA-binding
VNLWGFQTIQEGPNKGGCFHPLFARGSREKVHYMTRQKVKGINGNGSSNGKPPVNRSSLPSHKMSLAPGVAGGGSMVVGQQQQLQQHPAMLPSLAEIAVATNPGLMMALREARTSNFTDDELKALPFMKKLHHILAQPELGDCISWTPDGRCIRVIDPFKFLEKAQAKYFDHSDITSFSSFLLELESYGFRKVTHLGISECYYHDVRTQGMTMTTHQ